MGFIMENQLEFYSTLFETEKGDWVIGPTFSGENLDEWISAMEFFLNQFQIPDGKEMESASETLKLEEDSTKVVKSSELPEYFSEYVVSVFNLFQGEEHNSYVSDNSTMIRKWDSSLGYLFWLFEWKKELLQRSVYIQVEANFKTDNVLKEILLAAQHLFDEMLIRETVRIFYLPILDKGDIGDKIPCCMYYNLTIWRVQGFKGDLQYEKHIVWNPGDTTFVNIFLCPNTKFAGIFSCHVHNLINRGRDADTEYLVTDSVGFHSSTFVPKMCFQVLSHAIAATTSITVSSHMVYSALYYDTKTSIITDLDAKSLQPYWQSTKVNWAPHNQQDFQRVVVLLESANCLHIKILSTTFHGAPIVHVSKEQKILVRLVLKQLESGYIDTSHWAICKVSLVSARDLFMYICYPLHTYGAILMLAGVSESKLEVIHGSEQEQGSWSTWVSIQKVVGLSSAHGGVILSIILVLISRILPRLMVDVWLEHGYSEVSLDFSNKSGWALVLAKEANGRALLQYEDKGLLGDKAENVGVLGFPGLLSSNGNFVIWKTSYGHEFDSRLWLRHKSKYTFEHASKCFHAIKYLDTVYFTSEIDSLVFWLLSSYTKAQLQSWWEVTPFQVSDFSFTSKCSQMFSHWSRSFDPGIVYLSTCKFTDLMKHHSTVQLPFLKTCCLRYSMVLQRGAEDISLLSIKAETAVKKATNLLVHIGSGYYNVPITGILVGTTNLDRKLLAVQFMSLLDGWVLQFVSYRLLCASFPVTVIHMVQLQHSLGHYTC